ncbi:MAG: PHP domain-containing protein [Anaerofustis stercorihominis]|nr:PHP domain-containing protein [Anaerofustis stercorihominis]
MSRKYPVDLHIHTTASDGKYTPEEVIRTASKRSLKVISITDHDTVDGYSDSIFDLASSLGVELVTGIEFSCFMDSRSVHILGYFIDIKNETLSTAISKLKNERVLRMEKMVKRLNDMGMSVDFDEIMATADSSVGRPHLARHLMNRGYCKDFTEAFEKYIGEGCPAYVKRESIPVEDIISLIHEIGGISVIAHPKLIEDDSKVRQIIDYGIKGIEVVCPSHNRSDEYRYAKIADEHSLLKTGGSDFHGSSYSESIGSSGMSYDKFAEMKKYK